jgi:hypothetical protein
MLRIIIKEVAGHRHRCPKSLAIVDIEALRQLPLFPDRPAHDYFITSYAPASPSVRPIAKARLLGTRHTPAHPLDLARAALAALLAADPRLH